MLYSNPTIYKYIRIPIYAKGGIGVHLKSFSLRWALVPLSNLAEREVLVVVGVGGPGGLKPLDAVGHNPGHTTCSRSPRLGLFIMSHKTPYKTHRSTSNHEPR